MHNLSISPRLARLRLALAFFGFALVGLSGGAMGVLLPSIGNFYRVNNAVLGLLFLVSSGGYFLSAFCTGLLSERLGQRAFLIVGALTFAGGYLLFGLQPPFFLVLLARLLSGFGAGIIETGLNVYIAALPRSAALLNHLHAYFGVGSLVGPLIAGSVLALGWDWNVVFVVFAILGMVLLSGFVLLFDAVQLGDQAQSTSKESALGATLRTGAVWLAALFLLVYVGVEVSLGNWSFSYLLTARHIDTLAAGWMVSGLWLGLTLGRFVLENIAERFGVGPGGLMYLCMAGLVLGIGVIWALPFEAAAAIGLFFVGLSLGPIYPLTVALTPRLVPAQLAASTIGFIVSASIIGLALFPWLAGILIQFAGSWSLLPFILGLTGIMGIFWQYTTRLLAKAPLSAMVEVQNEKV
jgi:fucose permease